MVGSEGEGTGIERVAEAGGNQWAIVGCIAREVLGRAKADRNVARVK